MTIFIKYFFSWILLCNVPVTRSKYSRHGSDNSLEILQFIGDFETPSKVRYTLSGLWPTKNRLKSLSTTQNIASISNLLGLRLLKSLTNTPTVRGPWTRWHEGRPAESWWHAGRPAESSNTGTARINIKLRWHLLYNNYHCILILLILLL